MSDPTQLVRICQFQIGWIFKSNANESYCLYNSEPMVRHYALLYGFHTLSNMLKNLLERGTWLYLYTNALPLTSRGISERERPQGQGFLHL